MEDVNTAMKRKVDKKGSFNNKIYLEYVDEKNTFVNRRGYNCNCRRLCL